MLLTLEQVAQLKNAKNILDSLLNELVDKGSAPTFTGTFKSEDAELVNEFVDQDYIVNDLIRLIKSCYTESTDKTQKTQVTIILNQLEDLTRLKSISYMTVKDLEKLSIMDIVGLHKTSPLVVLKLLTFCDRLNVKLKDFDGWSACFNSDKITITDTFRQEQEALMRDDLKILQSIDYDYNEQLNLTEEIDNTFKIINRCKNRLGIALSKIKTAEELK